MPNYFIPLLDCFVANRFWHMACLEFSIRNKLPYIFSLFLALAASLTCASVALANAGIEMYDLVVGCSAVSQCTYKHIYLPPQRKLPSTKKVTCMYWWGFFFWSKYNGQVIELKVHSIFKSSQCIIEQHTLVSSLPFRHYALGITLLCRVLHICRLHIHVPVLQM